MADRLRLPPVIGHRGAALTAPENTVAGFRKAAELGTPWVEFDVRLTADGHCVLFHDDTLDRIAGRPGRMEEIPSAVALRLDAGSWFGGAFAGEPIPTLDAALDVIGGLGMGALIELKPNLHGADALVQGVIRAASRNWPRDALPPVISSFDRTILAVARRLAPGFPRALIARRIPPRWRGRAEALGCASIHIRNQALSRVRAARIKKAGFQLAVWSVDDRERARELWDWGVDAVITGAPGTIMAARRKWETRT